MRLSRALSRNRKLSRGIEQLETRRLLTIVVDDPGDISDPNDGRTTLREAVAEANAAGANEDIVFTCDVSEVSLTQGQITVGAMGHDITIDGMLDCPDEGGMVTVNADNQFRVFNIDDGDGFKQTAGVIFRNLNITGGSAIEGGGILNRERLTLSLVNIFGNTATNLGPPSISYGGGLANVDGSVEISDSTITNNLATSIIPIEQAGFGGGLSSRGDAGEVTLLNTSIGSNTVMGNGGGLFVRGGTLKLVGTTVRDNKAGGVDDASHNGGGLALYGGGPGGGEPLEVDLTDTTITGNLVANNSLFLNTTSHGGGMYVRGNGTVRMTRTMLLSNEAGGDALANAMAAPRGGGAFFVADSATGAPLNIEIEESQIDGNTSGLGGGGLFASGGMASPLVVNIERTSISGNAAAGNGGGIAAIAVGATVPGLVEVNVTDSSVGQNTASNGAISNGIAGRVTIERSTIEGNTVSAYGGGIHNQGFFGPDALQPVTIVRNSTLAQNSAAFRGGGVFNQAGILEIFQSTLSGNQATSGGGGFLSSFKPFEPGESAEAEAAGASNFTIIDRSTITQNTAVLGGGGIAIEGAHAFGSTINSTIIADNEDLSGQAPDVLEFGFGGGSVVPNTTFSLIGIADGSSFIPGNPSTSGNFVGSSNNPLSPQLTGLIDAGGSTMVHVPQAGSVVVDNGDPNVAGGLDQLGQSRVSGGRMDIGAVETLATLPDCDINQDGTCDCNDLNLLSGAVASGTNPLSHDLDGNGLVEFNDLLVWLADAGARPEHVAATGGNPFLLGDANLDGTVDGADFLIWNSNKFSNGAAYCQGDFNADGYVDGLDFVIWNANKFLSSDAATPTAIPYPVATFQPLSREAREEATDRVFRTNPLFRGW